jgi:hypothetical protein
VACKVIVEINSKVVFLVLVFSPIANPLSIVHIVGLLIMRHVSLMGAC